MHRFTWALLATIVLAFTNAHDVSDEDTDIMEKVLAAVWFLIFLSQLAQI